MRLSYYAKKRITDVIISIFMLAFLALTLLPIGWMVYSSLKDSTDIAIGKVGLRRARTNILMLTPENDDQLLALSEDGSLNYYQAADLVERKHKSYKTAATSYALDPKYIWIMSANKGLIKVNRDNFKKAGQLKFKTGTIDTNKVPATYIKKIGNYLYVSMDYKRFAGVWKVDGRDMRVVDFLKNAKPQYFPHAGTIFVKDFPGVDGEVFCELREGPYLFLGATGGRLYKYDTVRDEFVAQVRVPKGHLLIRFHNYIDMWKNVNFGLFLRNSLIICGFTMVFAMILATFAAYALSRFRFPGSDLFSNAILATQMIPMIMYLIPIYIMFVKFTLLTSIPVKGTFYGIILIYSAWFLPFSIWILRGFFAAIPRELEEAALIDGCSRLRVFWHVALPLAMPGIIATGIYIFLNAWDELMFAWVLTNADTQTIPVGIRLFVGNYQNRFDLMMAAAVVATVPVVVLFFLLQRHIVRGLTAGAVKG